MGARTTGTVTPRERGGRDGTALRGFARPSLVLVAGMGGSRLGRGVPSVVRAAGAARAPLPLFMISCEHVQLPT